ncbi:hypothetical protein OQA88_8794 [Cercophora sp. LCS_1]
MADPPRRSNRAKKAPAQYIDEPSIRPVSPKPPSPKPASTVRGSLSTLARRNPKRKAAPEVFDLPDHLLETSLGPWAEGEQKGWPSWTEVESDPAFFNVILQRLGIKGAKIEEVYSVDEESLGQLPAPVYGLIFLYEYVEEESREAEDDTDGVWFANQTTHNACATIAMLNIMMNAEGIALGDKLRQLKNDSMDLSPPLRGNLITNSPWIRVAHNSFARRLDLLNAALSLKNDVDESKKKKAKKTSTSRASAKKKKKKQSTDTAYHFIAFVPVGNSVWQLDGLEVSPARVGDFADGEHWTSVAAPVIERKMLEHERGQLSFNLLAMCGDYFAAIRKELAVNIHCLDILNKRWGDNPAWSSAADMLSCADADKLREYDLDAGDMDALSRGAPELEEAEKVCSPSADIADALKLQGQLTKEQQRVRSSYETETKSEAVVEKVHGRTKDHTLAIHMWVTKLAEHGVLQELHQQVQLQN